MYKIQKNMKFILSINLFVIIISFSCWRSNVSSIPKNIILFIGDGMGVSHITAAKTVKGKLNLEEFKVTGLITTHCADRYVTDSGAAATALATGNKTYYSGISMTASGVPMKTVLEYAEEKGMSTGLVVTSRITHATPAAFASHVRDRYLQSEIAEDLVQSEVEVLFGGGLAYFLPNSDEQSRRKDEKNLIKIKGKNCKVLVKQIAGVFARRIVCILKAGDFICQGDRSGMIRFGSRVEITFPTSVIVNVSRGEKVRAGSTVIGLIGHEK